MTASAARSKSLRRAAETHRVIKGRRWRVSDPVLDEPIRQHLVNELMDARRAVKTALVHDDPDEITAARRRVHDAKVALGERGPQWWKPMTRSGVDDRARAFVRAIGHRTGEHIDVERAIVLLRLEVTAASGDERHDESGFEVDEKG